MLREMPKTGAQGISVAAHIARLQHKLSQAGIESGNLDARLLVQTATGLDHAGLILQAERVLTEKEVNQINALLTRRLRREPVSRILGEREFYGRTFAINGDVLDPRPDTETLVDKVLEIVRSDKSRPGHVNILDMGTGSGAIAVTLLAELPQARATATDISPKALAVARKNSVQLGVADRLRLVETSWCAGLSEKFDIVVSNPPYISSTEMALLDAGVSNFDPHLALEGGKDGLEAYRAIAAQAPDIMGKNAPLLLEIGFDQAEAVTGLFAQTGFVQYPGMPKVSKDYGGNDRVVTLCWPAKN